MSPPRLIRTSLTGFLLWLVVGGGTSLAFDPPPQGAMETNLDFPLHFKTPEGKIQVLPSGDYRVETEDQSLRLVHQIQGTEWVVEAQWSTHNQDIPTRMVVSIPQNTDVQYLVVLFPDGKSLEAIGSSTGVWSRDLRRLGSGKIRESLESQKKPAITTLRPVVKEFFTTPELWTLQPNGTLFLKGGAFGTAPGEVYVRLQDPYPVEIKLAVEKWTNTEIRAKTPGTITGVRDHVASFYVKRPDNARSGSRTMNFKALRETRRLAQTDSAVKIVSCSGGGDKNVCNQSSTSSSGCYMVAPSKDPTIAVVHKNCDVAIDFDDGTDKFSITLKNGWVIYDIKDYRKVESGEGWIRMPDIQKLVNSLRGQSSWTQSITWEASPNDEIRYAYTVDIVGPKGVPH